MIQSEAQRYLEYIGVNSRELRDAGGAHRNRGVRLRVAVFLCVLVFVGLVIVSAYGVDREWVVAVSDGKRTISQGFDGIEGINRCEECQEFGVLFSSLMYSIMQGLKVT